MFEFLIILWLFCAFIAVIVAMIQGLCEKVCEDINLRKKGN